MSRPRNCRHCTSMVCGDVNWCCVYEKRMTDGQILVARSCPDWDWNEVDALTLTEWEEKPSAAIEPYTQLELGVEV